MSWRSEWKSLIAIAAAFGAIYYMPIGRARFDGAVVESLHLAQWYTQEHVLLCLVPAFFIAGAMAVFVSGASVMRYLGPTAPKALAYGVAAISGGILAVCSCTVLPLFAGIYKRGAGLGPATAFLYSGPAVNVLAIILTARVLGVGLGLARALGAVFFSIIIGISMHLMFRREELAKAVSQKMVTDSLPERPLWQNAIFFGLLVTILVGANLGVPTADEGIWWAMHANKWRVVAMAAVALAMVLNRWFGADWRRLGGAALVTVLAGWLAPNHPEVPFALGALGLSLVLATDDGELEQWLESSWGFAKQILPLLFVGVLLAGLLLGRPGGEGLIPSAWVNSVVGGNSILANLLASMAGALMYFATLTEVPILAGLLDNGMGKGPALALLLAGPAVSLPNMLVIASVIGWRKTLTYLLLVVVMATITGLLYGQIGV